jgi:hypothetical protein
MSEAEAEAGAAATIMGAPLICSRGVIPCTSTPAVPTREDRLPGATTWGHPSVPCDSVLQT